MLDVQQIFGRAGRPQFDTSGEANIITTHSKLAHYLGRIPGCIGPREDLSVWRMHQPWTLKCCLLWCYLRLHSCALMAQGHAQSANLNVQGLGIA